MKTRLGMFLLPAASATPEEFRKGYAGKNPNYYQKALKESAQLIQQAENLGFDFVAFSEHHFHVEGLEMSNNPVLLGSWAAALTKRLRIGQMGNVLPVRNPVLLAEDLAMLDQFSGGRMFGGMARGYQSRHVMTIGQKYNATATYATDPNFKEHDRVNRELFEENYNIIKGLWENDLYSHKGKHWQLPPDNVSWGHPKTKEFAQGMTDEDGMLRKIGIAPGTLQEPSEIEMMVPFTMSKATIQWAAAKGIKPVIHTPIHENIVASIDAYHEAALAAGRNIKWGENIGHFREVIVADTDEEAFEIGQDALGFLWTQWHDWFGFNESLRYPGEKGPIPNNYRTMVDRGNSLVGSVDTVARRLEEFFTKYNPEMLVLWVGNGPANHEKLLRSNDLLVNKVLPKIGVSLEQFQPKLRKEFQGNMWTDSNLVQH